MSVTTALVAIPQVISMLKSLAPEAATLIADAEAELAKLMAGATVSTTQIQQDDTAMDAADAALQAAQPGSGG